MTNVIYNNFKKEDKQFAVLIDPDKVNKERLTIIIKNAEEAKADYLFVGGSLVVNNYLDRCLFEIKALTDIPVILFPGSTLQINDKADAVFFLSVISGRNPELLIGQHVIAAPMIKKSSLEVIPTGYMLIDGGRPTTVSYISNTIPIPSDKNDIAVSTALAGEMLGLKLLYMDAGSGAKHPISETMINSVKQNINIPLIVGGGIKTPEQALIASKAGADIIVIGNAIEKNPSLLIELALAIRSTEAVRN